MSVSSSSVRLFVGRIATMILNFAALAYFARALGSADLGVFFLFQAALSMLVLVSDVGLSTAVEKRLSAGSGRSVFWTGAMLMGGIASVLSLGLVLFRDVAAGFLGADLALTLVVALGLSVAQRLLNAALRGELRTGELASLTIAETAVQYGVAAVFVWSGLGAEALVVGVLLGLTVSDLWALVKVRPAPATPTKDDADSLLEYAKYNAIPTVGLQVHNWMDVLIIGVFLAQSDVGAYEVAWRVAGATTLLAGSIGLAIMPQASAWDAEGAGDRVGRLVSATFVPALLFVIPAVVGALVIGADGLRLIFGSEFERASLVLVVLVAGQAPAAVQSVVGRTLLGLDRPNLVARATIVSIVLNLVLNVVLVVQIGLIGAALATTLSFTVGTILRVRYLDELVPLTAPTLELGWCGVAATVMGVVLFVLDGFVTIESVTVLLGFVLLGSAIYGLVLVAHPSVRRTLLRYARSVVPRVAG
ncbi:oligosaccharide flippase family protein [Halogranum rubrum]|uniref:Uncharacterized protein n=1 Tax=Halogranum salarium B-1 TaxID=1210908 RepID=J3JDN6_9EURY|nr:oligosaccharide flippase family protein [Halogranum salarium]EJN57646.1 hypothetical protein HSB1_40070 [Halogranum salarium B-1]